MVRHILSTRSDSIYNLTPIIENQFSALAIFDREGSCLYHNPAFQAFVGPPQPEDAYRFQSLILDLQTIHEILQKISAGKPWAGTARIRTGKSDTLIFLDAMPMDEGGSRFFVVLMPMSSSTQDRRAWNALQESEHNYRRLLNLSPSLILICVHGKIHYINPSGLKMLGAAGQEKVIGRSLYDFIQPKDHEDIRQRMEHMEHEGFMPVMSEERWLREDGALFDIGLVIIPFNDRGERAVQIIGNDISEKTRANEQLSRYTRQLLALNMIGLAMVSSLQTNEVLNQVTQSLREILSASTFTILLNQSGDMVSVASSGANALYYTNQSFPEVLLHQHPALYQGAVLQLTHSDFAPNSFLHDFPEKYLLVMPLNHAGELMGMLCAHYLSAEDMQSSEHELLESAANWVTVALQNARLFQNERKQHQLAKALLQSANAINSSLNLSDLLDHILQQVSQVLPCRAANIMIIEGNELRVVSHLGYERRGSFHETVKNFHAPLERYSLFQTCLETRQPFLVSDTTQQPYWVSAPGSEWIRSYASSPLIAEDRVYGFLNLDSDESNYFNEEMLEQLQAFAAQASIAILNAELVETLQNSLQQEKQIRAQMVQSEKLVAMGRMVASVAHELNNPLQTIRNCLFILQNDGNLQEDLQEYLDTGLSEIERLSDMVAQLRGVYRPKTEGGAAPVDLVSVLEHVRNMLKLELQRKSVAFQILMDELDIQVRAVPDQLRQVFFNISHNAIQAMEPEGGKLSISIQRVPERDRIGIVFDDNGKGIQPDDLPHIFDPFFTTRDTGFGLGLALCQEMITSHGGTIEARSEPGKGSSFTVWLPDQAQK